MTVSTEPLGIHINRCSRPASENGYGGESPFPRPARGQISEAVTAEFGKTDGPRRIHQIRQIPGAIVDIGLVLYIDKALALEYAAAIPFVIVPGFQEGEIWCGFAKVHPIVADEES